MTEVTKRPQGVRRMSMAEVAEAQQQDAALRAKAARQASKDLSADVAPPECTVRVLKMGADKISTGQHVAGIGEVHYEFAETFKVARPIAQALEDRGFVEIQEDA